MIFGDHYIIIPFAVLNTQTQNFHQNSISCGQLYIDSQQKNFLKNTHSEKNINQSSRKYKNNSKMYNYTKISYLHVNSCGKNLDFLRN